jgi:hypothetical protein
MMFIIKMAKEITKIIQKHSTNPGKKQLKFPFFLKTSSGAPQVKIERNASIGI